MASPGKRRGVCGHAIDGYDQHSHCAHCQEKKKATDPCVQKQVHLGRLHMRPIQWDLKKNLRVT